VGVDFRADKIIDLAVAYKTERVKNNIATVAISNGARSNGASGNGPYHEVRLRV